jgi:CheY-like chemotaxis protein
MPEGGTLTLETSLTDLDEASAMVLQPPAVAGSYVELAVSDTGTGMSDQVAAHIFEPFFTTKPAGEGTGLGLATVYAVVTGAGGSMSVRSEEGSGTRFRLFFPAAGARTPGIPASKTRAAQGRGQTILVVDDDPPVLSLTSRILRQNGYATMEAGTFDDAMSLASSQDVQLLLTDSVILHRSGSVLAERVADVKPGLPILYMSGHSAQVLSPDRVLDERAEYIQKPFTPQALLDKVHAALDAAPSAPPPGS